MLYLYGNIFESPAQVLVNTVNTVGVMGKGIALTYKKIYPDMFDTYRQYCENKSLRVGSLYLYKTPGKWILNFPTKTTWRKPSEVSYIEEGLKSFVLNYQKNGIKSIAFPMLGCGNGGLDFQTQVKPLMDKYLSNLNDIEIYVYINDQTKFIEHKNIKQMKEWLNINNYISLSEFIEDICSVSNGLIKHEDEYNCTIKDEAIDFIIIKDLYFVLNHSKIIKEKHLRNYLNKFLSKENSKFFEDNLKKLRYVVSNYKDISNDNIIVYNPSLKGYLRYE